jgi:hypothetical protein
MHADQRRDLAQPRRDCRPRLAVRKRDLDPTPSHVGEAEGVPLGNRIEGHLGVQSRREHHDHGTGQALVEAGLLNVTGHSRHVFGSSSGGAAFASTPKEMRPSGDTLPPFT